MRAADGTRNDHTRLRLGQERTKCLGSWQSRSQQRRDRAPKRAVLVDQHPLFLEGMERVLAGINVEVVGKAGSADQALALVEEQEPDLLVTEVLLDGNDMDGISCVREARALVGHLEAVVVSALDDPGWVSAAFEAGAKAYVLKTARPDDLAVGGSPDVLPVGLRRPWPGKSVATACPRVSVAPGPHAARGRDPASRR